MSARPPVTARVGSVLSDAAVGARWLWRQPPMRFLAASSALINFFTAATGAVLVIYVRDVLHLGGLGFGLIESGAAIGGVLAGFAVGWTTARLGTLHSLAFGAALQAVGQLLLLFTSNLVCTVVALGAASFATVQFSSVSLALRQSLIPTALLGRVLSTYRMLAWGSLPVGALAAGLTVHWFGVRVVFGLGAVTMSGLVLTVLARGRAYGLANPTG